MDQRAEWSAGRGRLARVSPLSRSVVHHQLVVARLVEVAGWQPTRSDVHLIVETECWPTPMAAGAAWWPRLIPLGPLPISSGSVAVGDRFLSGPAVPAAPPPPVPVLPFGGGLNWWTRRWSWISSGGPNRHNGPGDFFHGERRDMVTAPFVGVELSFPGNHATLTALSSNQFSDHNNNYRTTSACAVWKLH